MALERGDNGWAPEDEASKRILELEQHLHNLQIAYDTSVAQRRELEALVPHPGDGSCDKCGKVPSVHVPMSLCPDCYGDEKRIDELEANNKALQDVANAQLEEIAELEAK